MIGRYEKFVRRMVRPKDVIGRYEKSFQRMIRPKNSDWTRQRCCLGDRSKVRPKDSDWTRRRCCLGYRPKVRPKDSDWMRRSNLSVWRCVRLVVLPDWSDWTRKETCLMFWDASDLLIQLICFQRLLLASLLRNFRQPYAIDKKTITRKRLLLAKNTPFWSVLDAQKQSKRTSPLFTYATRGGITLLCTMPMMWLGKCVCV